MDGHLIGARGVKMANWSGLGEIISSSFQRSYLEGLRRRQEEEQFAQQMALKNRELDQDEIKSYIDFAQKFRPVGEGDIRPVLGQGVPPFGLPPAGTVNIPKGSYLEKYGLSGMFVPKETQPEAEYGWQHIGDKFDKGQRVSIYRQINLTTGQPLKDNTGNEILKQEIANIPSQQTKDDGSKNKRDITITDSGYISVATDQGKIEFPRNAEGMGAFAKQIFSNKQDAQYIGNILKRWETGGRLPTKQELYDEYSKHKAYYNFDPRTEREIGTFASYYDEAVRKGAEALAKTESSIEENEHLASLSGRQAVLPTNQLKLLFIKGGGYKKGGEEIYTADQVADMFAQRTEANVEKRNLEPTIQSIKRVAESQGIKNMGDYRDRLRLLKSIINNVTLPQTDKNILYDWAEIISRK